MMLAACKLEIRSKSREIEILRSFPETDERLCDECPCNHRYRTASAQSKLLMDARRATAATTATLVCALRAAGLCELPPCIIERLGESFLLMTAYEALIWPVRGSWKVSIWHRL